MTDNNNMSSKKYQISTFKGYYDISNDDET